MNKLYRSILSVMLLLFLSLCFVLFYLSENSEPRTYKRVRFAKKTDYSKAVEILEENGFIDSSILFYLFSRFYGYDKRVRWGEFCLPLGINSNQLVKFLIKVAPLKRKVTLIEGLSHIEIFKKLSSVFEEPVDSFKNLFVDETLLKKYHIKDNIEGYLMPETYFFTWGTKPYDIVDFLISKTYNLLKKHEKKIASLGFTKIEILTLASIIEAESNYADEKPIVSSVYHNRLRKGWKLEADPTIIFILGKPQRVLFKHLKIDSPYNTYMYHGLPPSPINNPGKDAILAAIFPKETDYLYFTGTGDGRGRHLFGKTFQEHNKNRSKLDELRKKK